MENSNVTPLVPKEKTEQESILNSLSPREIVSELDRFVVGQNKAKRAKNTKLIKKGKALSKQFNLAKEDIEDIYDVLESEGYTEL